LAKCGGSPVPIQTLKITLNPFFMDLYDLMKNMKKVKIRYFDKMWGPSPPPDPENYFLNPFFMYLYDLMKNMNRFKN
jgi:hypothetical protein